MTTSPDRAGLLREARADLRRQFDRLLDDRWPLAGPLLRAVDEYVALAAKLALAATGDSEPVDPSNESGLLWQDDCLCWHRCPKSATGDSEGPLDVERLARALDIAFGGGIADTGAVARVVAREYAATPIPHLGRGRVTSQKYDMRLKRNRDARLSSKEADHD